MDGQGRPSRWSRSRCPTPSSADDGRLPASYANFYVGTLWCCSLSSATRRETTTAIETLSGIFHGQKVVPVDSKELVYGFGGIHCVTQQQPAPV